MVASSRLNPLIESQADLNELCFSVEWAWEDFISRTGQCAKVFPVGFQQQEQVDHLSLAEHAQLPVADHTLAWLSAVNHHTDS